MSECGACGSANPTTAKFCGECGASLAQTCPACGHPASAGQKFCGECGSPLGSTEAAAGSPAAIAPAAPAGAELRLVSVLFCDLVGYTSLSEGLDSDEVRDLLSGYFDVARTIVARYGGEVGKFIGDAVMAVWGATRAGEDDAERAVRAALELVDAVPEFGAQHGKRIACRVGIVTGRAAATETPGEGIVVGDRVNTAARAQSAAEPGQVLVDDDTRLAAQASIAFSDAGLHAMKGKAAPVRLWRAEHAVAGTSGSGRVDGLEARFVGRDAEFRLLKELFHASADRRTVRLVSVVGPAGSGKTRLGWEFRKYLDGLADIVLWHSGRCLAYGEGVAYWSVAEMVRQRFGIAEDDPATEAARKLGEGLDQWIDREDERVFLRPRLGQLLGVGAAGSELSRDELFSGWRLFFERLADGSPVVLTIEDLHWADPGLLDFLEHLIEWSSSCPIFILTLGRSEVADRAEQLLGRHATVLGLDPVDTESMAKVLDDLVVDLPPEVRDRIVTHAEGIPLFAVETVRSLIDRELVVPREGVYRLTGEVDDLEVPPTLAALLTARLDSLDRDERELVKDLSVLGTSFSRPAIDAVTTGDPAEVDRLLDALRRKEILSVRSDPLSPDQGHYAFTQNLLRTVAYESLTRRERKARHLAAASQLRRLYADDGAEVVEVIAAHLDLALEVDPDGPDATSLRAAATAAHERAGHRAETLGSPDLALTAYRRAAELADGAEQAARLTLDAAAAAVAGSRYEIALEVATDAQARFEALGRRSDAAHALALRGRALIRLTNFDAAIALLGPAVASLPPEASDAGSGHLLLSYGRVLSFSGRHDEAAAVLDRCAAVAGGLADPELLSGALNVLGILRCGSNRVTEGLALLRASIETGGDQGQERTSSAINLGYQLAANDEPAAEVLRHAVTVCRRLGDRQGLTIATVNICLLLWWTGEWDQAEQTARELLADDLAASADALAHSILAILAALRGDPAGARDHLAPVARLAESEDPQERSLWSVTEMTVLSAEGSVDDVAARIAREIQWSVDVFGLRSDAARQLWPVGVDAAVAAGRLDVLEELVDLLGDRPPGHAPPFLRAVLARAQALLAEARGETEGVEDRLRRAVDEFARLGYPYWLAQAQLDLARWLRGRGDDEEATSLERDATSTLDRMGAVLPERALP